MDTRPSAPAALLPQDGTQALPEDAAPASQVTRQRRSGPKAVLRLFWRLSAWVAIAALSTAAGLTVQSMVLEAGHATLSEAGVRKVDLYYTGLESELRKFEYLPRILRLDPEIRELLESGNLDLVANVNQKLELINRQAGSIALSVLTTQGLVLAASNWNDSKSLVGQNLAFSPSFQDALHKGKGNFYTMGGTGGAPGYYFAHEIAAEDRPLGVGMLEADLDVIEKNWWPGDERALVFDDNGVVILSSTPEWKFKSAHALPEDLRDRLWITRKYNRRDIGLLGLKEVDSLNDGGKLVSLPTPTGSGMQPRLFMARSLTMPRTGWTVVTLTDTQAMRTNAKYTGIAAGLATALLGVMALYWQVRRQVVKQRLAARKALEHAYGELEKRVLERTAELRCANEVLIHEVAERKRAEEELLRSQDELVQAGKLATLGQMAAGITHELNQPLHALHTHCSNALQLLALNRPEDVSRNIKAGVGIIARMGRITSQLKNFARRSRTLPESVHLARAVDNALALLNHRMPPDMAVHLALDPELRVHCDGNRLEQVFINLFSNAIDAMRDTACPGLRVTATPLGTRVRISVADTGPGLSETVLQHLFEPFFSTKPSGEGLGLGLVISASILRTFGTQLEVRNAEAGGAVFEFDLELLKPEHDV